jgi:hypothetical protein
VTTHQLPAASSRTGLTSAGRFWYILSCIWFGAGYLAKVPVKKALADTGLCQLTGAETFWYYLGCLPFGFNYFAKLPAAKALSELDQFRPAPAAPLAAHQPAAVHGSGGPVVPALEAAPFWLERTGHAPEWPAQPSQERPRGRHVRS